MASVHYIRPDGTEEVVEATVGDSVMATAVRNGITGIVGQCGGTLSCATCHVYLDADQHALFDPPGDDEDEMLDCTASDREDTSRLSCQLTVQEGVDLRVTIPDEQV